MPYAITCEILPGALNQLKQLRLRHLEYIQSHENEIMFGGPARSREGLPETMIIILATDDRAFAEAFIAAEPYRASGEVFADVKVRPWSQVLPLLSVHSLDDEVALERAQTRETTRVEQSVNE